MRKETPVSQGITALQRKDFFYDGVRRIQEIIYRPNVLIDENLEAGAMATQGAGDGAMNDELAIGMELADGSTPDQQIVEDQPAAAAAPGPGPPEPTTWTDREYVYGPDYVDEIIAAPLTRRPTPVASGFAPQRDPDFVRDVSRAGIPPAAGQAFAPASARGPVMYVLQDANYNVVALVATNGNILEQYAYEPYGTLAARDDFGNHAVNRVGHQGLFFERFDGTYADGTLDIAPPGAALGPIGIGLYFARNRFYGPGIGRWTTADPNATGVPILSTLAHHGELVDQAIDALEGGSLYVDGCNLHQYVRANPAGKTDPSGLSEEVDEIFDAAASAGPIFGILQAFKPIVEEAEERNLELERFAELAANDELDAALADFERAQLVRWDKLQGNYFRTLVWSYARAIAGEFQEMSHDFFASTGAVIVYIGRDSKNKARYVGITEQPLGTRERQHGGIYKLRSYVTVRNRKQARAIEQLIIDENYPDFDNRIASISERHRWRSAALKWGRSYMKKARKSLRIR
jgi:hypothetical protein